ncbi:hypothetical protein JVT61DRAFT_5300 [Boletus reticuloceps]|uniref:Rab-GAP TBC domain-containing protein n=1 Tax=Boletus reticuloceps TaxID=495285 RepID=A0A8I2Z137_9AGAM|nr:hypothetical protein JVT61DRAFT_5300 [Boletus reticuloceps]
MLQRQPGKGIQVQLTLDDAFADVDDQPFEFSSAAVRQHFAEQVHWVTVDQATDTNSVDEPDTSISTFYLDGSTRGSKSDSASVASCVSQSHTHDLSDVPESSDELSNVSLTVPETKTDSHSSALHEKDDKREDSPHPAVHIDVSKPPSSRVSVITRIADGAAGFDGTQRIETPSPTPSAPDLPTMTASTSLQSVQKVVSKTRPYFLPPKSRKEDKKHMADWEAMMMQSRAAEEKRRKGLQERRLARELRIEQSIHVWESEIVPDWRVVHRDPDLRKIWWNGIPTKLRASMWERAAGNALTLSKDSYRSCLSRAKRALSSGVFPKETLQAIEDDILVTLPALHIFHPESGPLYQDLKDLICAWVVARADEGLGYTPGTSKIAAMILVNMSAPQGFVVMRNLLERHCLRSFYTSSEEDVEAYYRIFDTLLADSMPKIYFNFKQHQISPAAYLPSWLMPLFLDHLPFEACARLWDVVILEGDSFLFRAALAVLAALEPRLFFPERQELLELLNGENKAAIEVARRDGRALDGGKYEIYGIDEETLWDRIESMNEWWRETTWRRLTQRELPDL